MLCVIGSTALNVQLHTQQGRLYRQSSKDIDVVGSLEQVADFAKEMFSEITKHETGNNGDKLFIHGLTRGPKSAPKVLEAELVWAESTLSGELQQIILNDPKTIKHNGLAIASMDVLYMLKMSHRYLRNSPFFLKTMDDIHALREFGAVIRPEHMDFFKRREKATYWYKHPSLMRSKTDFFDGDGVQYVYDHDSIHESVKIGDAPAYTHFQAENAEVMCDMDKFFTLPEEIRLNAVYEESCVLALERSVVPFNTDPYWAFTKALEKVCSSITSGRFREYAWENYHKVKAMYNPETFARFFRHVEEGKVAKHVAPV